MDNVFILNHLVQRESMKRDKKIYSIFVDLKVAIDNVERETLWKILKEKGFNEEVVRRLSILYEGTRSVVRTKEGVTNAFETRKGGVC